jgi:hypothetical protein
MNALSFISGSCLLALIFLALFVPTSYPEIKIVLLILTLLSMMLLAGYIKIFWDRKTILACIFIAVFGLLNSLHGVINDTPGALRVLSVMSVWPIFYLFLSSMLNRPDALRIMVRTLEVVFIAVLVYSFLFLGRMINIVSEGLYFELDQGQAIGLYDGTIEFSLHSVASLLFLMPFYMHYIFKLNHQKKLKLLNWLIFIIGFVLTILTGRRAVLLILLISPFIIYLTEFLIVQRLQIINRLLLGLINLRNTIMVSAVTILLIALFINIDIRLDALVEDFMRGFDFDNPASIDAVERGNQYKSLINGWYSGNILFGAGNGSHTEYLRSSDMPWAYELTYIYLLFSNGIIGILFYFSWFGWGLLRIRRALKLRPDMALYVLPMITGTVGFAIGAASNPYFGKFDFLWIIFLPHLLAGAIIYQRKELAGKNIGSN